MLVRFSSPNWWASSRRFSFSFDVAQAMNEAGGAVTRARLARYLEEETAAGRLDVDDPGEAADLFYGMVGARQMRALLGLPDAAGMERMAQRIVAEGLSVRSVEELVALGDGDTPPRRSKPRAGSRRPQLDDLAADLSDRLETRVRIALGQKKGRLTVEFASVEDLNRILDVMKLRGGADSE